MYTDKYYSYEKLTQELEQTVKAFTPNIVEMLDKATDRLDPLSYHHQRFPLNLTGDQKEITKKAAAFYVMMFGIESLNSMLGSLGGFEALWLIRTTFTLFSHNYLGYEAEGINPLSVQPPDQGEQNNFLVSSIYVVCFFVSVFYSCNEENFEILFVRWLNYFNLPAPLVERLNMDMVVFRSYIESVAPTDLVCH